MFHSRCIGWAVVSSGDLEIVAQLLFTFTFGIGTCVSNKCSLAEGCEHMYTVDTQLMSSEMFSWLVVCVGCLRNHVGLGADLIF